MRQSIERVFKGPKESRRLDRHCVRGLRQISLHATISVLAFQATALIHVRARGDGGYAVDGQESGLAWRMANRAIREFMIEVYALCPPETPISHDSFGHAFHQFRDVHSMLQDQRPPRN